MRKYLSDAELPGAEIARYLHKTGNLMSVRDTGVTFVRGVYAKGWSLFSVKKEGVTIEEWRALKLARVAELPTWARNVRKLPSVRSLERWAYDSVCKSVTGATVEPDGHGPDGAPSWLIALGMI